MRLASTEGSEAAVRKTKSFEYWDERPAEQKLSSLADYLEDVRSPSAQKIWLWSLTSSTVHCSTLRSTHSRSCLRCLIHYSDHQCASAYPVSERQAWRSRRPVLPTQTRTFRSCLPEWAYESRFQLRRQRCSTLAWCSGFELLSSERSDLACTGATNWYQCHATWQRLRDIHHSKTIFQRKCHSRGLHAERQWVSWLQPCIAVAECWQSAKHRRYFRPRGRVHLAKNFNSRAILTRMWYGNPCDIRRTPTRKTRWCTHRARRTHSWTRNCT